MTEPPRAFFAKARDVWAGIRSVLTPQPVPVGRYTPAVPDEEAHEVGLTDLRKPKHYPAGLVAEQHYQDAVMRCSFGERVTLFHEIGNPHDENAIVAVNARDEVIGYVPRKSFIQQVVHDQGQGIDATILQVQKGQQGFVEVVLDVAVNTEPMDLRAYDRAS